MRHADVALTYESTDISSNIKSDLMSFSYEEKAEGEADSLTIGLHNKSLKWLNAWLPKSGDSIAASLTSYDWNTPGEILKLDCGTMQVDEPEFAGPPDTVSIKALNIPATAGFNDTPQNNAWESISLKELGQKIAGKYGMTFIFDSEKDFTLSALKQSDQTDADFLKSTAGKYNLCMKVYSKKLILYSKYLYEQREPVLTLTHGASNISGYTISAPTVGTGYSAAVVSYQPTDSSTVLSYEFRIAQGGKAITVNESVDDIAQAELVAKAQLRSANETQYTGSFTLSLNLKIVAACTIKLSGYGKFDGKYFVDSASHSYGGGAGQTSIEIHKCLEGGY